MKKTTSLRRTAVYAVLATAILLVPTLAPAQKPTITIVPFPGIVLAPTEPFCGFNMIDTAEPNRPSGERLIQFANAGVLVGPNFVQLQNANTGQTIDLNSSGPATSITVQPDGTTVVVAEGPSIWNTPPPPLEITQAAGLPPVPYILGKVTVVVDQNGNITSMKAAAPSAAQNICSLF